METNKNNKLFKGTILVALNNTLSIGKDNQLMYHIKDDLRRFKELTEGNVVIMGRKTFESLPNGEPLKNRINIILTNNKDFYIESDKIPENTEVYIVNNLVDLNDIVCTLFEDEKKYIIGGSQIYRLFLENNMVSDINITWIDDETRGDTFFPRLKTDEWDRESSEIIKDSTSAITYQYVHLTKKE